MARTVLVTGSSRGIGKAIALQLALDGYDIVVHYKTNLVAAEDTLHQIRDSGHNARILQFDINSRQICKELITQDMEENGVYYGVVCNAGLAMDNPFPSLSGEEWDQVIETSLKGFYNVLHPIIMPMIRARHKGRIVTLSSVSGITGNRGQVNYSAAKAGIIGATKSLALELAKREITVNCIAPGLIETDMISEAPVNEILKAIPMRRLGKPEDVAALASFLFSDKASYITRQVISVNGGLF